MNNTQLSPSLSHELFLAKQRVTISTFEDLILRLPHLGEAIFDNLDNQSVTKCVEVNEMLQNFIHEQKSYWIRKIKCFFNPFFGGNFFFRNEWVKVLKRPSKYQDCKDNGF